MRLRCLVIPVLLVVGCGRVSYRPADSATGSPDASRSLDASSALDAPLPEPDAPRDAAVWPDDAFGPDAWVSGVDAGVDAEIASDAGLDAAMGASDAGFDGGPSGGPLVVVNTASSGPGSLSDAIATVNRTCSMTPQTITFDIPETDPGFVGGPTGPRYWRIEALASGNITCASTTIDGTTQTVRRGNTNPSTFGGVPVGAAGVPLPVIQGPEIELLGVTLSAGTTDVTVRGLALGAFTGTAPGLLIEQCVLGGTPDGAPLPGPLRRVDGAVFYTDGCVDCVVRETVIVGANGPGGLAYNVFSYRSGSTRATVRDCLFTGALTAAGGWDELYLNPAEDHRVIHNRLGTLGLEYHVEWVPGYGGEISENTFVGPGLTVSMGGAAVMTGNVTVP